MRGPLCRPNPRPPPRSSCQSAHGPRQAQDPRNSPAGKGRQKPREERRPPEVDQQGSWGEGRRTGLGRGQGRGSPQPRSM